MGVTDTWWPWRLPAADTANRHARRVDPPVPGRPRPLRDPPPDRDTPRLGPPGLRNRHPGPTLRDRLPADLRDAPTGPRFENLSFTPVYLTDHEWAAELANQTVHAVLHLGWVPDGAGEHRGQMAVLVKPNGLFGTIYMAAIAPFRHLVVYPELMRSIGQRWRDDPARPDQT